MAMARRRGDAAGKRVYEAHKGLNYFLLRGRVMTSQDNIWMLLLIVFLVLAMPMIWMAWMARYLWTAVSPVPVVLMAYFYLNAVACLMCARLR